MRRTSLMAMLFACLLVVGLAQAAAAADDLAGTAAFMNIGLGARAMGMGGAFVSIADDATCVYYNPAGLAIQDGRSLTSFYTNQYGQAGYLGFAYAQKGFGGGILTLSATDIQGTDEFGNPTETYSLTERALLASAARTYKGLHIGGTVKYYSQSLPDLQGSGVTCDLGLLYEGNQYKIGAVGRNLFGQVSYANGSADPFDRVFVVGVSTDVVPRLTLALDYETNRTAHVGGEYRLDMFDLRGGAVFRDGHTSLTAGLGVRTGMFRFDYAYETHEILPDMHRLSVQVRF